MLEDPYWKQKIEFTYIGNNSPEYNLKNTHLIRPLAGLELAEKIKEHHIYVTASVNEPSGNHHIEAAQCGLPILYKDSGGIPEYCKGYGVSFSNDFIQKLKFIINDYNNQKEKISQYPFSAEKMCKEFVLLFENLLNQNLNSNLNELKSRLSNFFIYKNKIMLVLRNIFSFNIRFKLVTLFRRLIRN